MIKKGARIKEFTALQKQQLEAICEEEGINNANDVLLLALDKYLDQKRQIARLTRFNEMKQLKIEELKNKLNQK
jgi:hypothetical protein